MKNISFCERMFGGGSKCGRCGKSVYAAEEMLGAGLKWHKTCFRCKDCGVGLSSQTMADKAGEIYCKTCYAKNFGPKGYGFGGGLKDTGTKAVDASSSDGKSHTLGSAGVKFCDCGAALGKAKFCPECGRAVAEPAADAGASSSSSSPSSSSSSESADASERPVSPSREASNASSGGITVGGNSAAKKVVVGSDNPKCPLCGKSVYHAEKVIGAGATWHQDCFKCSICRTRLGTGEANDKDGKLFCRACYAKQFGPKGYGYGGGSATTFAHTQ